MMSTAEAREIATHEAKGRLHASSVYSSARCADLSAPPPDARNELLTLDIPASSAGGWLSLGKEIEILYRF